MKVILLGINYEPETTGIGPYTTRLAQHLAKTHEVSVFTGYPHYPQWSVPDAWRKPGPSAVNDPLQVHHLRHYVPARQDAVRRTAYELSWSLNALRSSFRQSADLVIAVVPPLFGAAVAHLLGSRFRAPVGVIVQDVMSSAAQQSGVAGGKVVARGAAWIERGVLKRAAGVLTIHPRLADVLQANADLAVRPRVIPNWTHIDTVQRDDVESARKSLGWGNETVVLHSGNMGLKQNLHAVLDAAALAEAEGDSLRFVLAGGGNEYATLAARAASLPNVDVIASVPSEDFPGLLRAADVLLVNERPGMDNMSLPSKLTSYFTSGRPVVAAVERDSATASFIEAAGAGVVVPPAEPALLLQQIRRLTDNPGLSHDLGQSGRRFASEHLTEEHALAQYDAWVQELVSFGRVKLRD